MSSPEARGFLRFLHFLEKKKMPLIENIASPHLKNHVMGGMGLGRETSSFRITYFHWA